MEFPLHDETTAPEAAREALATTKKNFGMIPNLEKVMASAPPLLSGYSALWDLFDQTTLSPIEHQVVYLTANYENECDYCVPWHSLLARKVGMDAKSIEALRAGAPLPDHKTTRYGRLPEAWLLIAARYLRQNSTHSSKQDTPRCRP